PVRRKASARKDRLFNAPGPGRRRSVVDRETLLEILATLSEYLEELKGYQQLPREKVLGDRQVQSAVRYAFQTAIQCALDAGLHLLVDSGLARPRDQKEVLQA